MLSFIASPIPALQMMALETAAVNINWHKTQVKALGSREDEPLTITAQGCSSVGICLILALLCTEQPKALLVSYVTCYQLSLACKT